MTRTICRWNPLIDGFSGTKREECDPSENGYNNEGRNDSSLVRFTPAFTARSRSIEYSTVAAPELTRPVARSGQSSKPRARSAPSTPTGHGRSCSTRPGECRPAPSVFRNHAVLSQCARSISISVSRTLRPSIMYPIRTAFRTHGSSPFVEQPFDRPVDFC